VKTLLAKLDTFQNVSEEFWSVYDELWVLVDHGVQVALRAKDKETEMDFKEILDNLKERVPSGYWK
jgi:hypothetical protein